MQPNSKMDKREYWREMKRKSRERGGEAMRIRENAYNRARESYPQKLASLESDLFTITAERDRLRILAERAYPNLNASGLCSRRHESAYECTVCYPDLRALITAHNKLKQEAWAERDRLREAISLRDCVECGMCAFEISPVDSSVGFCWQCHKLLAVEARAILEVKE